MPSKLITETPNFDKIEVETGKFTAEGFGILWDLVMNLRAAQGRDFRQASETLAPLRFEVNASAQMDNLDIGDASVVEFVGSSAQSLTGIRQPPAGQARLIAIWVTGTGTITLEHEHASSQGGAQLINLASADVVLTTNQNRFYMYMNGRWREM